MGNNFSFEVKGLNRLIKRFDNAPDYLVKELGAELSYSADEVAANAADAAPKDDGYLWKEIHSKKIGPITYEIISPVEYSAYVEFGTGEFVEIPKGLEAYARQFYVNGKGRLHARPFLFPAFQAENIQLIKKIKNILKDLV